MVARDLADLSGLDDCLEPAQRLVEQVILHDTQHRAGGARHGQHALSARDVVAHRLLKVDVPPLIENFDDAVRVQGNRKQALDGIDLELAGGQLRYRWERGRLWPVGLPLRAAFRARVHQCDHLDVGVSRVGAHIQVVDPAQADERGADRAVVWGEGHHGRAPLGALRSPQPGTDRDIELRSGSDSTEPGGLRAIAISGRQPFCGLSCAGEPACPDPLRHGHAAVH